MPECNNETLEQYLTESGLKEFNEKLTRLTKVWFMGEESDDVTEKMGEYIILSGAYGTDINFYVNGILRISENKKEYFLERLFPKYELMCYRYPVLKKHKPLLPAFWGIRIFETVFDIKRIKNEATGIAGVEEETKNKQEQFLRSVGL